MTAVQERPAGRPAGAARPAGAQHGERERYRQHILEHSEPCAPCREAERAGKAEYRRQRRLAGGKLMLVDGTGTRRRVQALAAIGWPASELAARAHCDRTNVSKWTRQRLVHRSTRATVIRLYDELSMTPGPSEVTRGRARRAGWPPPLAWEDELIDDPAARPHRSGDRKTNGVAFDEVAVARAVRGDQVFLRPPERAAAVRVLTGRGRSTAEIAELLGTTKRSVTRHRTTDTTRRSA